MPLDPRMREDDTQHPSFPALPVIPGRDRESMHSWIPAFAGMTGIYSNHG